jgi:hypothetical protein
VGSANIVLYDANIVLYDDMSRPRRNMGSFLCCDYKIT